MSMKAVVSSTGVVFEVEAEQEDELFKQVARVQEIFHHTQCGKCQTDGVRFVSRLDKESNDWLEIVCQDNSCRAKLVYGRTKKGGIIYPKIRWDDLSETQQAQRADEKSYADAHKGYLPNKGWFVYRPVKATS